MTRRSGTSAIAVALLLSAAVAGAAWAGGRQTTTVILVRHAEKRSEGADPSLSEAGRSRAQALAHVLERAAPAAIFCSQYRRTEETVRPLAERLGLAVRAFPIDDVERSSRELARTIRKEHRGRVVVVAGHSNTLPVLIEALGAGPAPEITHDRYDDLFVVTLGGSPRLLRLKYGAPGG